MENILKVLFSMQDIGYREFQSRLMPNIDKERIIGVRTPDLRRYAKELGKKAEADGFLESLPHKYYEENNLHGFIIENLSEDYSQVMRLTEEFLPYIDNWATCDSFAPKVFKKNKDRVYLKTKEWLNSSHTYVVRYGIVTQLRLFLDEDFNEEMLGILSEINSDEYYINMALAWYFSIALIKQYPKTIPLFKERSLNPWVHNKALQKATESFRVPKEKKDYFRTLKIKVDN